MLKCKFQWIFGLLIGLSMGVTLCASLMSVNPSLALPVPPQTAPALPPIQNAEKRALDQRLQQLTEELRCLVCQNQSLAESHAELAVDLKEQVREKMRQGLSNEQIVEYMTIRYGDFILYRPPLKWMTGVLWFGPGLLLLIGLGVLYLGLRRKDNLIKETNLSEEETARVTSLLDRSPSNPPAESS